MMSIRIAAAAAQSEGARGSHLVQSMRRDGLSGAARHDEVVRLLRALTIAQVCHTNFGADERHRAGRDCSKVCLAAGECLAATLRLDRKLAELELADDPAEARALRVL